MRIILKTTRRIGAGYALIITLIFLAVCLTLLGSMLMWTSTNGQLAARNNTFIQSEAAAEAATEMVFAQMDRDFLYGVLQGTNVYEALIPSTSNTNLWPVQYTFSDPSNNVANQTYVYQAQTLVPEGLDSQYSGLNGLVFDCYITSTATPVNTLYTVPATVSQYVQIAEIPIFQFAIFYNINLEIDPGAVMKITGPVFSNAGIWAANANLTFSSTVQAVGQATITGTDPFANGYTCTPGATYSLAGNPTSQNNALTMPVGDGASTNTNPTNIEAILNLPPAAYGAPNTIAYAPSNQVYLFNESDLIISNASFGINGIAFRSGYTTGTNVNLLATNFTVWFQDRHHTPLSLVQLTNDYILTKDGTSNRNATNQLYAGFSFLTNVVYYDYRESDLVQAVQIDIAKFNMWLTNSADEGPKWNTKQVGDNQHGIYSIYVYNSVPISATQLPAVRIVNGSLLPTNGLTISSPFPVYVEGNYNVEVVNSTNTDIGTNDATYTYPAAIMGDAVTVLSTNWNDSLYINGYSEGLRVAAPTTLNAACLEGIVPSNPNAAAGWPSYSGGVENFLRLEEKWSGVTLTYNGSIVVMFPSVFATNVWQETVTGGNTSGYYDAPTRHWAFDANFEQIGGLPPLTPSSKAMIRGQWTGF